MNHNNILIHPQDHKHIQSNQEAVMKYIAAIDRISEAREVTIETLQASSKEQESLAKFYKGLWQRQRRKRKGIKQILRQVEDELDVMDRKYHQQRRAKRRRDRRINSLRGEMARLDGVVTGLRAENANLRMMARIEATEAAAERAAARARMVDRGVQVEMEVEVEVQAPAVAPAVVPAIPRPRQRHRRTEVENLQDGLPEALEGVRGEGGRYNLRRGRGV